MERKLKICGVCQKETVIWKAKTKDHPQMCKDCYHHQNKPNIVAPLVNAIQDMQLAVLKQKNKKEDKSVPELLKLAEIVFNRWIRNRDTDAYDCFTCISCGEIKHISAMDCGHFYPKTFAATRFHEDNNNSECSTCNRIDPNHLIGYKINLLAKIGIERMKELKRLHNQPMKWDKQVLLDIITKYK